MTTTTDKADEFAAILRICGADLPEPQREYRFDAKRRWRFDFAWPNGKGGTAVEVDGGQWKPGGGRHGSDADREKLAEAGAQGWIVLHFSPAMLRNNPGACVDWVRRAISR